jgi:hypothetical protein
MATNRSGTATFICDCRIFIEFNSKKGRLLLGAIIGSLSDSRNARLGGTAGSLHERDYRTITGCLANPEAIAPRPQILFAAFSVGVRAVTFVQATNTGIPSLGLQMESLLAFLLAPPPLAAELSGNVNPSENPDAQEGFPLSS